MPPTAEFLEYCSGYCRVAVASSSFAFVLWLNAVAQVSNLATRVHRQLSLVYFAQDVLQFRCNQLSWSHLLFALQSPVFGASKV